MDQNPSNTPDRGSDAGPDDTMVRGVGPDVRSSNRRRRLLAALSASPVALTLASRSAWANGCSISGMHSGNMSHVGTTACEGLTPGFWKNHTNWPGAYSTSFKFNSLPGFAGFLVDANGAVFQAFADEITLIQCFEPSVHSDEVTLKGVTHTVVSMPSNGLGQEFLQEVVSAIISAAYFKNGEFGYDQPGIVAYIAANWFTTHIYADLKALNQDVRPGFV